MAAPWRNKIIDALDEGIRGLHERVATAGENVQKLMENSRREGTADDLRVAAENANKKIEEFNRNLNKFKQDLGEQRSRPLQLGPYLKMFEELEEELYSIDHSVSGNLLALENSQEPKEVEGMAEEQKRSPALLQSKELQSAGNAASQTTVGNIEAEILLQDMRGMENFDGKKILKETPSSSYGKSPLPTKNPTPKLSPAPAAARTKGEKEIEALNQFPTGTNRNLCDIMMALYGFERIQCERIDEKLREELTRNPSQGTGSLTEAEWILNWTGVWKVMKNLESLKKRGVQNVIPEFLLKVWIFRMENQMYRLVLYLRSIMAGFEAAMETLWQLRTSLEELRQGNNGMVPILVHRILALLALPGVVEQSDLNRDQQEALYGKLGFNELIDSIRRMILQMTSLLNPNNAIPNALETYERVLREVGKGMDGLEKRILDGMKDVREKRKRDDGDGVVEGRKNVQEKGERGDEDGGNGGRSLEM